MIQPDSNHPKNEISYQVSPSVTNDELNALFSAVWDTSSRSDFTAILNHSLAFIGAYHSMQLIGFVNVAWDGGIHAFILDTAVHPEFRRQGIGVNLVKCAIAVAKEHNIEWVHVDYEPHLQTFYGKCDFRKTTAGVLNLKL